MNNFKTYLEEGRDAPLYHGTDVKSLINIKKYNTLYANTLHILHNDPQEVVSLSRSYKFAYNWVVRKFWDSTDYAILELDQRKLAQRYKIVPYNHFGKASSPSVTKPRARELRDRRPDTKFPINQYEECVVGDIKNIDKYIIKIHTNISKKKLGNLKDYPPLYNIATRERIT